MIIIKPSAHFPAYADVLAVQPHGLDYSQSNTIKVRHKIKKGSFTLNVLGPLALMGSLRVWTSKNRHGLQRGSEARAPHQIPDAACVFAGTLNPSILRNGIRALRAVSAFEPGRSRLKEGWGQRGGFSVPCPAARTAGSPPVWMYPVSTHHVKHPQMRVIRVKKTGWKLVRTGSGAGEEHRAAERTSTFPVFQQCFRASRYLWEVSMRGAGRPWLSETLSLSRFLPFGSPPRHRSLQEHLHAAPLMSDCGAGWSSADTTSQGNWGVVNRRTPLLPRRIRPVIFVCNRVAAAATRPDRQMSSLRLHGSILRAAEWCLISMSPCSQRKMFVLYTHRLLWNTRFRLLGYRETSQSYLRWFRQGF